MSRAVPSFDFNHGVRPVIVVAHVVVAVFSHAAQAADTAAPPYALPEVRVIDTAPLPGPGLPPNQVPANVQSVTGERLAQPPGASLGELLERNLGSVHVNDTQGNPYQADVSFRGFTASPILGTPSGMSVFVDGVRVNEAFGDTVNWDLIPRSAIAGITLLPGSNPVFGPNTLGGALVINTKNGLQNPGTALSANGGSFGRQAYEFETGGYGNRVDYFVAADLLDDNGWARHNASRVNHFFGKTGVHGESSNVEASITYADTKLAGNQTLPLSLFGDPTQAYTAPDTTANRLAFFSVKGDHAPSQNLQIAANGYYRALTTNTFNSNISNTFNTALPPGPGNQPASNAINQIDESRYGASFQLTALGSVAGRKNNLTIGTSYDRGGTSFTQFSQEAPISADRDTTSTATPVLQTSLRAVTNQYGLYATDTYALGERTQLTVSGRYNEARLELEDRIGTALNGTHRFHRFNPAAGITHSPGDAITFYATYNEGMRIPTPVELTCADPTAPCSLPNAFAADPPLNAVVSKTREIGARGRLGRDFAWRAALFRTDLGNDIQFVSSGGGATSTGFFQNVGSTRRQGLELGAEERIGKLAFKANYTYLSATFQTPLILNSPNNSTAQPLLCPTCTDIQVVPGNRIPGIPHHLLKLRGDYRYADNFSAGMTVLAASSQFARGDENNLDVNGTVPGYAVANFDTRYKFARNWDLIAALNNAFNHRYQTFGILGQNVFTAPGNAFDFTGATYRAEQFRTAAAPRTAWIGIAYRFSAK